MKFGKVDHPELVDFSLPKDHPNTAKILNKSKTTSCQVYVGCAKWNKQDLKGFYPRGTKDELAYYSRQFNSIELNATFYRIFPNTTVEKWYDKTPEHFKFFPKVSQRISQFKRLQSCENEVMAYLDQISHLQEKLGTIFLQMHPTFAPKSFDILKTFVEQWPKGFPLAIELRHPEWFQAPISDALYDLFEKHHVSNIVVDTAGRRDLLHMALTNKDAFIRYNGANHESDYKRLDDWFDRIKIWMDQGLENLYFFVHQNLETESPLLSSYFIKKFNDTLGYQLQLPAFPETKIKPEPLQLF